VSDLNEATQAGVTLSGLMGAAMAEDPVVVATATGQIAERAAAIVAEVIEELSRVATTEGGTNDRKRRRAEVMARLHDEHVIGALTIVSRQRPSLFAQMLHRLRSTEGVPKTEIRALEQAIEEASSRSEDAAHRAGIPLRDLLRDLDPSLRLLAPPGYRVDKAGVTAGDDPVSHAPLVIRRVSKALDSGRVRWTLAWQHLGQWAEETVDRATASDGRALVTALAGRGGPANSSNSGKIVEYLAVFEAFNAKGLKPADTVSRLGWHGERYVPGPSADVLVRLRKARPEGWVTAGTREGWIAGWDLTSRHEVAVLCVYIAASAPLLRFLRLGYCPIFDLFGPSGVGKTTCVSVALSLFGVPWLEDDRGGIGGMWGGSVRGREERAADLWDVPMVLDDTAKMTGRDANRLVGEALYQLHRGASRDLASGHAEPLTWRNVVLSTGEKPAAATTEAGGAKNRVLSIDGTRAMPDMSTALAVEDAIREHYGHIGREVAAAALATGAETLQAWHREALLGWAAEVPCDTRLLSSAALVQVARRVLHEVVGVPRPHADPLAEDGLLRRALGASADEADQGERALEIVREDLQTHAAAYRPAIRRRDDFGHVIEPHEPFGGWRGVVGIEMHGHELVVVHAQALRTLLGRAGHDLDPVLRRWKASGVIVHHNHGMKLRTDRDGRPVEGYPLLASRLR